MNIYEVTYKPSAKARKTIRSIRLTEPAGVRWWFSSISGDLAINGRGERYRSTVYFQRGQDTDDCGKTRRGGVWFGGEYRLDTRGVEWFRSVSALVTDDYGTLVSSDTGVAP